MHNAAKPNFRRHLRRSDGIYPKIEDDPSLAMAHQIAVAVIDIAGPLFRAALALAFVTGALGIDLFH